MSERIAYISVSDKDGISDFAGGIAELGYGIYSHGNTFDYLQAAGLKVNRPDTLIGKFYDKAHPRTILIGSLVVNMRESEATLTRLERPLVDLVCVDLVPINNGDDLRSNPKLDFGGVAMLHAAALGGRIVIPRPELRMWTLRAMQTADPLPNYIKQTLAQRTLEEIARYELAAARYAGPAG